MAYNQIIKELCETSNNEIKQDRLKYLNEYLTQLFELQVNSESIYKELVGYGCKFNDWSEEKDIKLQEECKLVCNEKIWFNSNYNWSQLHLKGRDIFSYIKVYVSLRQSNVADIFIQTVVQLLKAKSTSFAAKISNQGRYETFVFWVEKKDFLILQDVLKPYEKYKPLKFIAYFGDYGISREFSSSQNDAFSELISTHFATIKHSDEVDVLKLFDIAIKKTDERKYNFNPLTLVVIVKTLFVLLGKTTINSNDFLFNDSENLWRRSRDTKRDYAELKDKIKKKIV